MKIRIIQVGFETFTGLLGDVHFQDGVSVADVSEQQAAYVRAMFVTAIEGETSESSGQGDQASEEARRAAEAAEAEAVRLAAEAERERAEAEAAEAAAAQAAAVAAAAAEQVSK